MAEEVSRKPYVREVPVPGWFFRHPRYVRYLFRELTCLFIGAHALLMVWGLKRLADGPEAWSGFLEWLRQPAVVIFQVIALGFALYHAITWFNLTPKALPMQVGEDFVPGVRIAQAHYAAWVVLSIVVLFLAGVF